MRLDEALPLLQRTPDVLEALLAGLPEPWLTCHEGADTWDATEVLAHLVEAERTNWMPRLRGMLTGSGAKLPAFDRFAHKQRVSGQSPDHLLLAFRRERTSSLELLHEMNVDKEQLAHTAVHPELGNVSVSELIATWVVHDMTHLSQILRVMAGRYRADVGPWSAYLSIIQPR
ncbi:DinB family protein [Paenibacillus sp. 1P07SE]|uniref:DinB family protein n=1 Tax=Paenibacillus sp. 1P07SE TaxID=3132209 RepID=UPI0039A443CB